ncbi:unnamed protein product [Gordionus sp. m RMFG-2023]|uniref:nuclear cap-binding protein subunit 1-like isoform X2 n=1 Tax=Gordionus sp. m RMFG-2023 TaxID=3053472 RepID=UPI0030E4A53B
MSTFRTRKHDNSESDEKDYNKKKMRPSDVAEIEKRLESLITRVGEKTSSSLESKIEGLARVLDADFSSFKTKIINILCHCVVKSPEKLCIYSTLVGLLNAKNSDAGGEIVEALVKKLKENLRNCDFDSSLNIVCFLADLVNANVLILNSILNLFENFLDVISEEGNPQVRADWYVYTILASLPLIGKEFKHKKESEMKKLFAKIESYMSKRKKTYVPLLQVWSPSNSLPQQPESLDNLWSILKKLLLSCATHHSSTSRELPKSKKERPLPFDHDSSLLNEDDDNNDTFNPTFLLNVPPYVTFEHELSQALQHSLPTIIPPIHNPHNSYPIPTIEFCLFEQIDIPEGYNWPKVNSIDKWLIARDMHSIIKANFKDRKQCAAQLLSYRMKNKIPLNYMIIECLFAELFNLPSPRHIQAMYAALFIELCKLQPSSLPPVLAQATELLFERLDYMHIVPTDRFITWFSHHLSNFQFKWSWEDWETCLEQDFEMSQPKFINETLTKCIRLSYYQRIAEIVPESFKVLLPLRNEHLFRFYFEGASDAKTDVQNEEISLNPTQILAKSLMQAFKRKEDFNNIINVLQSTQFTDETISAMLSQSDNTTFLEKLAMEVNYEQEDHDKAIFGKYTALKIAVFTETILHHGNKSFSHSFSAIAKYFSIFKQISEFEEHQYVILRSLYDYWRNNTQFVTIIIEKMIKTQLLNPAMVCNWVFSDEMSQDFTKSYIWENIIVHCCLGRIIKRVQNAEKDILDVKKRLKISGDFEKEDDISMDVIDDDSNKNDNQNVTPEDLERMEEKMEALKNEQKRLLLISLQRFIIVLGEYLVKCDNESINYSTPWYKYTSGRLQQIFLHFSNQINKPDTMNSLESLLFTSDVDERINSVFKQFKALTS